MWPQSRCVINSSRQWHKCTKTQNRLFQLYIKLFLRFQFSSSFQTRLFSQSILLTNSKILPRLIQRVATYTVDETVTTRKKYGFRFVSDKGQHYPVRAFNTERSCSPSSLRRCCTDPYLVYFADEQILRRSRRKQRKSTAPYVSCSSFYAREQWYNQLQRILAMVILSWCPFWCLSQPGTDRSPGEIETSDFHHMIACSLQYFATKFHAAE